MLSIYYIGLVDLLSKKAHAYNISKTCEALNARDDVSLAFITAHSGSLQADNDLVFRMHKIKKPFPIIVLKSRWDSSNLSKFYIPIRIISANWAFAKYLWQKKNDYQIIYLRDHLLFPVALLLKIFSRKEIFYEIHYIYNNWRNRLLTNWMAKISSGVITITISLQKYYESINKKITTIFCSGIDVLDYENLESDRKKINLPEHKILIGYAGNMGRTNLGDSYGLEKIVEALKFLPEEFCFVGVGERDSDAQFLKKVAKKADISSDRVIILPWQKRQDIKFYLVSFDILIVPCAGGQPGNSPTKMIEYMATGKPIIACKTEAITDVLKDNRTCLLTDNNPKDWAEKIQKIYDDKNLSQKITKQSIREALEYTWEKRTQKIVSFIKTNS